MNISLKQWKRIEQILTNLRQAAEHADCKLFELIGSFDTTSPEYELLLKIYQEVHAVRQITPSTYQVHPQSEWMGGDPDESRNHRLREPNCCPTPRRYFTEFEIRDAGAECLGPCQWVFRSKDVKQV